MRQDAERRETFPWPHAGLFLLVAMAAPTPAAASLPEAPYTPLRGSARPGLWIDPQLVVEAFGLAMIPTGHFGDDVSATGGGGGGLGLRWRVRPQHALRVALSYGYAAPAARDAALSGTISMHHLRLRGDYIWGSGWWRPYAGVGLSVLPWSGRITQRQTGLFNASGFAVGAGGTVAAGVDLNVFSNLSIAPEASWTFVGGDFDAGFWQAGLALRWEL